MLATVVTLTPPPHRHHQQNFVMTSVTLQTEYQFSTVISIFVYFMPSLFLKTRIDALGHDFFPLCVTQKLQYECLCWINCSL